MRLQNQVAITYAQFDDFFLDVFNRHAPPKKIFFRVNHKPYMTKNISKAIMKMSTLEDKYYKDKLPETGRAYKKQRN